MSPVWILKRLVSVFINACRLLSASLSLSQFGRGRLSLVAISFYVLLLLFGPCHLSEFTCQGLRNCTEAPIKRLQVICCEKSNFQLLSYLRRQLPTFCDAATGLPVKWHLRNEHRWCVTTQILVVLLVEANFPLGRTNQNTQIRVVTHH